MPNLYVRLIPEAHDPTRPLGRHVVHDPRSRAYGIVPAPRGMVKVSASWRRYTPILDQGQLGSCTGNATAGILGSSKFYGSLYPQRQAGLKLDETLAVDLYKAATTLDPWPGAYPPDDTGSSGLAAAQASRARGLSGGYRWAFGMDALHTAIQAGPVMVGVNWYEGMDTPDGAGMLNLTGQVRGGHEFELLGYSAVTDRWRMVNSWGPGWGANGFAHIRDVDMVRLLGEDGDATQLDPLT